MIETDIDEGAIEEWENLRQEAEERDKDFRAEYEQNQDRHLKWEVTHGKLDVDALPVRLIDAGDELIQKHTYEEEITYVVPFEKLSYEKYLEVALDGEYEIVGDNVYVAHHA